MKDETGQGRSKRPDVRVTTDERGREIVLVPLDNAGSRWAKVERADYDRLGALGLHRPWFVVNNGTGRRYVRAYAAGATGGQITIARAILGLGKGAVVRHIGGDLTDLRQSVIIAERGPAKRDDRSIAWKAQPAREVI